MKKNIKTWTPFQGFYGTMWELDTDWIEDEQGKIVPYERLNIDYDRWRKDVCEHVVSEMNDRLKDFSLNMRFQSIYSPREYNFTNDSINVICDVDAKAIASYIYENQEAYQSYLTNHHTSYDGFNSFQSNRFVDWEEDTEKFTKLDNNEYTLGSILEFICENEGIEESEFRDNFDKSCYEYIDIIDKTWDDLDVDQIFEQHIDEMDLEYGDIIFDINDAKSRAEIFSTDWKDELSQDVKIKLLSTLELDLNTL
jgi:hypothetical protein